MLRYIALLFLICSFLFGCTFCPKTTVCFTPNGNCTEQIIDVIDGSKKSIFMQAYEFTSKPIAKSLIRAKERGVSVEVILDESQLSSKYSVINHLFTQGIPIYIDYKPAIAHSKVIIIDNQKIITGSFNFTYSAQERNTENLLIIENNDLLVKKYVKNWYDRQSQSKLYQPVKE
ncbi:MULTISPECIES: phospholipase D family nuclease [unclassified Wolbachia]|uniref:phospholipase D family nuclease n=1 Tax=unclassified Wolbachia TaxID=2640676 RepID=UPI001106648A|nr:MULTISPECIES: phospholipase D family protein [unclassified Wolbachia]QVU16101.1 Phospholipase D-like protein [Wolbachia endosymbiont of Drosophila yakuba]QVU17303.1 Phospholipase D-like protein [Wolbachia endosymbiont of Drosophila santomea]QWE32407.1 Phospholipase D-like protein [Wolbachia endosymbiont of Drosophila simulans]TLW85647.1 phospholipase D family protein [Wolbachia endosymbiont of Drosophila teissieri]TLW86247.1 phospholipase D family protein [Wolbachia endosymbiont of Drosophi